MAGVPTIIHPTKASGPSHMPTITPFERPIPGQAWQHAPGSMPYDRPPQFTNVDKAMNKLFYNIMQPQVALHFLQLMDTGVDVPTICQVVLQHAASEGMIAIPMIGSMMPQLGFILAKMAVAAGITPLTGKEGQPGPVQITAVQLARAAADTNISPDKAQAGLSAGIAAEKTAPKAAPSIPSGGLMSPPNTSTGPNV